jgi:hypothetical protein
MEILFEHYHLTSNLSTQVLDSFQFIRRWSLHGRFSLSAIHLKVYHDVDSQRIRWAEWGKAEEWIFWVRIRGGNRSHAHWRYPIASEEHKIPRDRYHIPWNRNLPPFRSPTYCWHFRAPLLSIRFQRVYSSISSMPCNFRDWRIFNIDSRISSTTEIPPLR